MSWMLRSYQANSANPKIPTSDIFQGLTGKSYIPLALCALERDFPGPQAHLINGIIPDPLLNASSDFIGRTAMYLLLNATGTLEEWRKSNETLLEVQSTKASWASFQLGDLSLKVTACFSNPQPYEYEIQAFTANEEPVFDTELAWDPDANSTSSRGAYNSTAIREMLGATEKKLSLEQRQIFNLTAPANWSAANMETKHGITTYSFLTETLFRYTSIPPASLPEIYTTTTMISESAAAERSIHRTHAEIFQRVFQETGNPALAMQALWTILHQMAYYDWLPQYDITAPASIRMFEDMYLPVRWTGLSIILGLLGLHALIMIIAVVMFLWKTETSMLRNSWQAISQVVSPHTADAIHHGSGMTNKEMKAAMEDGRIDDGWMRISHNVLTGRTEATARRQGNGATYSAVAGTA